MKGVEDPSSITGADLLSELVSSNDVPSVLILPTSNPVPFSPSVFMNVDTRGGVSTFSGVSNSGNALPMTLRSRSEISLPKHYVHPAIPAKGK